MNEPVDAVITWVDGSDPVHAKKLADYCKQHGIERPEAAAPTRFNQCGELTYCVKSLLRFAPWIRTIYLVTDQQIPPIMTELEGTVNEPRVKLIDHRDLFIGFEACLPTFNSLTIESFLWRIPGLSEHFLYLNDDCFLIRPMRYDDFFRNNKQVLRGEWKTQTEKKWLYRNFQNICNDPGPRPSLHVGRRLGLGPTIEQTTVIPVEPKKWTDRLRSIFPDFLKQLFQSASQDLHRTVQEHSARLAGYSRHFFHLPHAPFPLRKKTFEDFFIKDPVCFAKQVRHAFRDPQQCWLISLALHLDILHQRVVVDNSRKAVTVHGEFHSGDKIAQRLAYAAKNERVGFVCMQSLDVAPLHLRHRMLTWIDTRLQKE